MRNSGERRWGWGVILVVPVPDFRPLIGAFGGGGFAAMTMVVVFLLLGVEGWSERRQVLWAVWVAVLPFAVPAYVVVSALVLGGAPAWTVVVQAAPAWVIATAVVWRATGSSAIAASGLGSLAPAVGAGLFASPGIAAFAMPVIWGVAVVGSATVVGRPRRWTGELRCGRCSYDLAGNVSGVCPECGEEIGGPPV